jgi:hypothetical protein
MLGKPVRSSGFSGFVGPQTGEQRKGRLGEFGGCDKRAGVSRGGRIEWPSFSVPQLACLVGNAGGCFVNLVVDQCGDLGASLRAILNVRPMAQMIIVQRFCL